MVPCSLLAGGPRWPRRGSAAGDAGRAVFNSRSMGLGATRAAGCMSHSEEHRLGQPASTIGYHEQLNVRMGEPLLPDAPNNFAWRPTDDPHDC